MEIFTICIFFFYISIVFNFFLFPKNYDFYSKTTFKEYIKTMRIKEIFAVVFLFS